MIIYSVIFLGIRGAGGCGKETVETAAALLQNLVGMVLLLAGVREVPSQPCLFQYLTAPVVESKDSCIGGRRQEHLLGDAQISAEDMMYAAIFNQCGQQTDIHGSGAELPGECVPGEL